MKAETGWIIFGLILIILGLLISSLPKMNLAAINLIVIGAFTCFVAGVSGFKHE